VSFLIILAGLVVIYAIYYVFMAFIWIDNAIAQIIGFLTDGEYRAYRRQKKAEAKLRYWQKPGWTGDHPDIDV
jgi:hypothetical protein